jgi:FdhD protein
MAHQLEIIRVDLPTKNILKIGDFVAEESPLHLFVNNTFWATILCSPTHLEELAVGHLLSEGILKSIEEIDEIELKDKKENSCYVRLKQGIHAEDRVKLSKLHSRVIPSACGSPSPYQYIGVTPKVSSTLKVKAQVIFESVNQLNFKAVGFRQTGALHVAAVYNVEGLLLELAEDVGRHNAADKVIGMAALNKVPLGECFLASSGRLSGDMTFKAARVGIQLIASLAAALSSGIEAAEKTNITLVGFVRGKRFNIYTSPKRIII